jgi:hypothetical protein
MESEVAHAGVAQNEVAQNEAAHNEAAHIEVAHIEVAHIEAVHNEVAHTEAAHAEVQSQQDSCHFLGQWECSAGRSSIGGSNVRYIDAHHDETVHLHKGHP